MLPTPSDRACQLCGHPLRGRSDKKFCDDHCRNAFNNEQNSARYAIVRRVNALLLRNRRILGELLAENETVQVSKELLLLRGFQFRYATHHFVNGRGATYHFCYELGWLELNPERFLLVRRNGLLPAL
ncbi:hypothetical protein [Flaviaesturariibacter terrae]